MYKAAFMKQQFLICISKHFVSYQYNEKIAIIFNEEPSGTVQIKMEGGDFIDCRRHNRQAYTFRSPRKNDFVLILSTLFFCH